MQIFIYSHTHWDREWYLSQNQFQYRLIRTVDEIIDLLEQDNAFNTFVLDGQTSVIDDYLELRPERRQCLADLIAARRLIIGPWFTMPDIFLPDGEALIRNLARGWNECRKWGADFVNVGYVPDSFGHIEQMPQLLRGFGIDNFVFSRGRPQALAPSQREFTWESPDGSQVLAWHLPGSYIAAHFLPNSATEPELLKQRITAIINSYANSAYADIVLLPHGIDHCWIQRDIGQILRDLPQLMPEHTFHHGDIATALNAWKSRPQPELDTYRGQLRGYLGANELHGTLSSRIDTKINNEFAQAYLENLAEPLDALAGDYGKAATPWFFGKAWTRLFQNHAHDSICGCSVDRVHTDVNCRFRETLELAIDLADSALDYLNNNARRDGEMTMAVFAGLSGGRQVVPFVLRSAGALPEQISWQDECGNIYAGQINSCTAMHVKHTNAGNDYWECRGAVLLPDLRSCELRRLQLSTQPAPTLTPAVVATADSLDNGIVRVEVNADGSLNLTDRRTGRTITNTHVFAQDADIGGGYHFEAVPDDCRRTTSGGSARIECISAGKISAGLRIATRLRVPASYDRQQQCRSSEMVDLELSTEISLHAGDDMLHCRTTLGNTARHQRLRLCLNTGCATQSVEADAAFAVHRNSPDKWPADPQHNFHPMRSFVHLDADNGGIAFIGRGLHEYEIVPTASQTTLEITLLRSVDFVHQCCTWETPEAQMLGNHVFDYALLLSGAGADSVAARAAVFRNRAIAEVHGDLSLNPQPQQAHATVGYYRRANDTLVPVDSNRSSWKRIHSQRDGWRRLEPERFCPLPIPRRIVPFQLHGGNLLVSAYKRADDGIGNILRFWNASDHSRNACLRSADANSRLQRCDLREVNLDANGGSLGELNLKLRAYEIVSVRISPGDA